PARPPGPRWSRPGGGAAGWPPSRSPAAGTRTGGETHPPPRPRPSSPGGPPTRPTPPPPPPRAKGPRRSPPPPPTPPTPPRRAFQRGQPPPTGDPHQAPGGARQQRPALLMPGRVVQHQQHLLARQVIPPPGRPRLHTGRDRMGPDPGRQQQARQRISRIHRP